MQTRVSLDLSATRFGDGAVANQVNRIGRKIVFLGHCATDRLEMLIPIQVSFANGFRNDDQLLATGFGFVTIRIHRERGDGTGLHDIAGVLHRGFDVLRVTIDAADDDHVLQASGNIQLPAVQETKVTGSQKRPFSFGSHRREGLGRLFTALPITTTNRRALHPDFSDGIGGQRLASIGIDDQHAFARKDSAASDQFTGRSGRGRRRVLLVRLLCQIGGHIDGRTNGFLIQCRPVELLQHGTWADWATGNDQCRLSHPVARQM